MGRGPPASEAGAYACFATPVRAGRIGRFVRPVLLLLAPNLGLPLAWLSGSNSRRGLSYVRGRRQKQGAGSLSDAHDPVELLDHAGKLGWCRPARLHPLEGFVGRPTGDCASLSDVDGNVVVEELPEEIARRGDPDALDAFGRLL